MNAVAALAALAALGCKGRDGVGVGAGSAPAAPGVAEPFVIAREQPGPSAVAVDDTYVYWNDWGKPLVRRAPRAGGPIETVYEAKGEVGGHSLALAGDDVYFDEAFTIARVPKAGGAAKPLGTVPQLPMRMTADRDGAYTESDTILAFARDGGAHQLQRADETWDVASDATHVYWIARDGVARIPKAGGAVQRLANGAFRFARIALSDTDVYFGDGVLESIFVVPKTGGTPRFVAHAWSIAAQALVYARGALWQLSSHGELVRVDPATAKATTIASGLYRGGDADHALGLAIAGDDAFVASGGSSMSGRSGTGLRVIDLTGNPNAPPPPAMTFGGEVLRIPIATPAGAFVADRSAVELYPVWFTGATTTMQDPGNAVRWIDADEQGITPDVRAGRLGLHLVGAVAGDVTAPIARARAEAVAAAIRARLGGTPKLAIETSPAPTARGDVAIVLDRDDLAKVMTP